MSKISAEQEQFIREQADADATLGDIQNGLRERFEVSLTYMEVRLLLIDLNVVLAEDREPEPEPEPEPQPKPTAAKAAGGPGDPASPEYADGDADGEDSYPGEYDQEMEGAGTGGGNVKLSTDLITRPGCLASGKVTFSDGKEGSWYLDGTGRLGIVPPEPGYQPSPQDIPAFQRQLAIEMQRLGY